MPDEIDQRGLDLKEMVRRWIVEYYGDQCSEFEAECGCCEAWKAFETLFRYLEED